MKTEIELIGCPFCGAPGKLQQYNTSAQVACTSDDCCAEGPLHLKEDGDHLNKAMHAWNTRAPAEDVRAVVEGPVGYASDEQLKRMAKGHTETLILCARRSHLIDPVALYRHPQRPVVLPERRTGDYLKLRPIGSAAWNACLDAVEELNKC